MKITTVLAVGGLAVVISSNHWLLGPFHGAIAVPSVTRCRWRRGHRCAGGVRQYSGDTWWMGVRRLVVANGPNIFQMLLVIKRLNLNILISIIITTQILQLRKSCFCYAVWLITPCWVAGLKWTMLYYHMWIVISGGIHISCNWRWTCRHWWKTSCWR